MRYEVSRKHASGRLLGALISYRRNQNDWHVKLSIRPKEATGLESGYRNTRKSTQKDAPSSCVCQRKSLAIYLLSRSVTQACYEQLRKTSATFERKGPIRPSIWEEKSSYKVVQHPGLFSYQRQLNRFVKKKNPRHTHSPQKKYS